MPAPSDYMEHSSSSSNNSMALDDSPLYCGQSRLDFYNEDFAELWRRDLPLMKRMGVNFLRLYDWNTEKGHDTFVAQCGRLGFRINLPIVLQSPDMSEQAQQHIRKCVDDALRLTPVVSMYTIFNGYDRSQEYSVDHVRFVLETILDYEAQRQLSAGRKLPIAVPVSYEGKVCSALQEVFSMAHELDIVDRLVNCVNIFDSGSEIKVFVKRNYGIGTPYRHVPLFIGEYGCASGVSGLKGQASFVRGQCNSIFRLVVRKGGSSDKDSKRKRFSFRRFLNRYPRLESVARFFGLSKSDHLLGGCLYTWIESSFKGRDDPRKTMGICVLRRTDHVARTADGDTYPVDELEMKPVCETVKRCFTAPR